jgi:hypothetical protein
VAVPFNGVGYQRIIHGVAMRRGLTPFIPSSQAHRQALTALLRPSWFPSIYMWVMDARAVHVVDYVLSRFTMAIQQRKQTSIILTFRILQFVKQIRRRVKPRVLDGSIDAINLGNRIFPGFRRISKGWSRISTRDAKQSRCAANRICKARQRNPKSSRSSSRPGSVAPASQNVASHEVQQYVQEAFVLFHLLKLRT